jgi:hypothetical protein
MLPGDHLKNPACRRHCSAHTTAAYATTAKASRPTSAVLDIVHELGDFFMNLPFLADNQGCLWNQD